MIGKTGKYQEVALNSQLCLLLREFKWPGFHSKTKETYARMSGWLGIKGYRLKDLVLNLAAKNRPDLRISQRIADHNEAITTGIYTAEISLGVNIDVANCVAVPSLHSRFGVYDSQELK